MSVQYLQTLAQACSATCLGDNERGDVDISPSRIFAFERGYEDVK